LFFFQISSYLTYSFEDNVIFVYFSFSPRPSRTLLGKRHIIFLWQLCSKEYVIVKKYEKIRKITIIGLTTFSNRKESKKITYLCEKLPWEKTSQCFHDMQSRSIGIFYFQAWMLMHGPFINVAFDADRNIVDLEVHIL
jgi:hypothetical protein